MVVETHKHAKSSAEVIKIFIDLAIIFEAYLIRYQQQMQHYLSKAQHASAEYPTNYGGQK